MSEMKQNKNRVVESFFSDIAIDYSKLYSDRRSGASYSFRKRLSMVLDLASGTQGQLLDCACGSGEITAALSATERYDSITAVDISSKMLSLAREKLNESGSGKRSVSVDCVNSEIFTYLRATPDRQFDLILCLGLIAHTGDLDGLLSSIKKHMAKDAVILLQSTLLNHPFTRFTRILSSNRYERMYGYRISYYTEEDIITACRKAGMKIRMIRRFNLGLPFGDRLWALGNYKLEEIAEKWANSHGAEALFMIEAN